MEIWFKQKKAQNELRTDWAKFLEKISVEKIEKKTVKIKVKLPQVNKKFLARKRACSNTVFSLYFEIIVKKCHTAKLDFLIAPPVLA